MLSYHASSVLHAVHADGGWTTDRRSGTRAATTFKKLPIASPGRKAMAASAASKLRPAAVAKDDVVLQLVTLRSLARLEIHPEVAASFSKLTRILRGRRKDVLERQMLGPPLPGAGARVATIAVEGILIRRRRDRAPCVVVRRRDVRSTGWVRPGRPTSASGKRRAAEAGALDTAGVSHVYAPSRRIRRARWSGQRRGWERGGRGHADRECSRRRDGQRRGKRCAVGGRAVPADSYAHCRRRIRRRGECIRTVDLAPKLVEGEPREQLRLEPVRHVRLNAHPADEQRREGAEDDHEDRHHDDHLRERKSLFRREAPSQGSPRPAARLRSPAGS